MNPSEASTRQQARSKSSTDTGQGEEQGSKTGMGIDVNRRYALLIGVGDCADYPKWSLPVTVRDVVALKKILVDPEVGAFADDELHMRTLTNEQATRDGILAALERLARIAEQEPEATVLIYFTGHGWLQRPLEGGERYYLVPHDVVPHQLTETALPAQAFIEGLRAIRSQQLLVMLDTYHAQGMAEAKDITVMPTGFSRRTVPEDLVEELGNGQGRAVFTSCEGSEKSWILPDESLSIFSHHLIEARETSRMIDS